jgi:hypothetical protein
MNGSDPECKNPFERVHFPKAGLFGQGLKIHALFEESSSPYFDFIINNV